MLDKVVSGGQTGADQAGWRAAGAAGVPTGGWMPLGWLTEDGPRPEFRELYDAREMPGPGYRERTERNVLDADATLWFGSTETPGAKATLLACRGIGRPVMLVKPGHGALPSYAAAWVAEGGYRTLNVAGNRESKAPGIGGRVERFMLAVFRRLGHDGPGA